MKIEKLRKGRIFYSYKVKDKEYIPTLPSLVVICSYIIYMRSIIVICLFINIYTHHERLKYKFGYSAMYPF